MGEMICTLHKLVVDVAIISGEQVPLVKYRDTSTYDHQEGWFLPDDYLLLGEHPGAAAKRVLREQLGIDRGMPVLDHIESFGGEREAWHLIFHYRVDLSQPAQILPGSNIKEASWFPLGALPPQGELAHHGWAKEVLDKIQAREQ